MNAQVPGLSVILPVLALLCAPVAAQGPQAPAFVGDGPDDHRVVYRITRKSIADLGPDTRVIRVLVHYSRSKFFVASGEPRGYEHDLLKEFEAFYNKRRKKRELEVPVVFVPVRFDDLIPMLLAGHGDVAAGLITITGERARQVTFTQPYIRNVSEVIVANAAAPVVASLDDLSGRKVHVLKGSSLAASLKGLNERLAKARRLPVRIVEMPPSASTEDLLEMVNAGIFEYTAADDHVARLWARVLPKLRVEAPFLSEGNSIAWAVRRDNPRLRAALNEFIVAGRNHLPRRAAELHAHYFRDVKALKNNLDPDIVGRKKALVPHFLAAGKRHDLDWLLIMAQGFQESALNQAARSAAGAVGVMQLLPATARDMGYRDVASSARSNIEAGAKYMRFLMDRYFSEPGLALEVRFDFALASYNAGPTRIRQMRRIAAERGLDPDRWFGHVERVVLEKIGEEPVRYVANIHSYYMAYKLVDGLEVEGTRVRKTAGAK
jgi:membrane-bound lytic murein transglycosylase MltF